MQLTSLSLALTRAGFLSFSPASLFAAGEPGVWYEPSLTNGTCFQDSSGTTPVTAVEQPVGLILDKSKGLVLGPELSPPPAQISTITPTSANGTISISGNSVIATCTTNGSYGLRIGTTPGVVIGRSYVIEFTVSQNSANKAVGTNALGNNNLPASPSGKTKLTLAIATNVVTSIYILNGVAGESFTLSEFSVRELPGNHATQTTSTSRPVLSARYNLLTKTEQFDDAVWTGNSRTVTANQTIAPNGTMTADLVTLTANGGDVRQQVSSLAETSYTFTFYAKTVSGTLSFPAFIIGGNSVVALQQTINITTEWQQFTFTAAVSAGTSGRVQIGGNGLPTAGAQFYIWGASLVPANQASLPYQRVNTATDYDADPSKFKPYLRFDGVDDWLVTPTITPGTDKAQVFAGVRKLSDAATGTVIDLNGVAGTNAIMLRAPSGALANYAWFSGGSLSFAGATSAGSFVAPITNVVAGIGDISADTQTLRVNGAQAATSSANQGTGNYSSLPLYIGRRGGTTLPFNGQLYSLIVRFGANLPAATIASTETWLNQRTGAY